MSKVILITFIIFFKVFISPLSGRKPPLFTVESEYRTDTMDEKSSETTHYFRERIRYRVDDTNTVNAGIIYEPHKNRYRYTWNACLNNNSGFSAILGNFYSNYGSGLLLGYSVLFDPLYQFEPLQIKPDLKTYRPCNSGNNVFPFLGITSSYTCCEYLSVSFFYSSRRRYANYDNSTLSCSVNTLLNSLYREYNKPQQVRIQDSGFACNIITRYNLAAQLYGHTFSIREGDNKSLLNTENPVQPDRMISRYYGLGFFMLYSDNNILIYNDFAVPACYDQTTGHTGRSFGDQAGLSIKAGTIRSNYVFRYLDDHFYAPYSSYYQYSQTYWHTTQSINPTASSTISLYIVTYRNNHISQSATVPTVNNKKGLKVLYDFTKQTSLACTANLRKLNNDRGTETYQQVKITARTKSIDSWSLRIPLFIQKKKTYSYYCGISYLTKIMNILDVRLNLTRFCATNNNILYTSVFSNPNSYSPYSRITTTCSTATCRISIKTEQHVTSLRYHTQFTIDRFMDNRIECYICKVF